MKKVLLTLCGAVLLMALVTAPALAQVGKDYQTPMMCSFPGPGPTGPFVSSGFAAILQPSGDLYVKLRFPPGSPLPPPACQIRCFDGSADPNAASASSGPIAVPYDVATGKVVARVPGLVLAQGRQCHFIQITCFDQGTTGWLDPLTTLSCVEGF